VIEQDDENYKGIIIYDLVTKREQKHNKLKLSFDNKEFDGGISHSEYFQEDCYYIITSLYKRYASDRTILISKVEYNGNIIEQHKYDNISFKMGSFSSYPVIIKDGIIDFQYGDQEWMIIYLFDNTLLQYRFDDSSYNGYHTAYLMNRY